jgi:hypothetical protein
MVCDRKLFVWPNYTLECDPFSEDFELLKFFSGTRLQVICAFVPAVTLSHCSGYSGKTDVMRAVIG